MERKELEEARTHSEDNELEILSSTECGCFFCRSHFPARAVSDWDYEGHHAHAICPECGMASVIGDASGYPITKEFLKEMNIAFYGPDYIRLHPEASRVYLDRYFGGKVTRNEKNEKLAASYLQALCDAEDLRAALALGALYEEGGDYIPQDYAKAEKIYRLPFLKNEPRALARLASMYIDGYKGPLSRWQVFEGLVKGAAFGNYEAILQLAHCYLIGFYVDADAEFAAKLLIDVFPEIHDNFLLHPSEYGNFIDYAYRIGLFCQKGIGVETDEERALRYFLLAYLGVVTKRQFEAGTPGENYGKEVEESIEEIAADFNFHHRELILDQDTFYDSFIEGFHTEMARTLVDAHFDEDGHTLDLTIEFTAPVVLLDLENLAVKIVNGKTQWHFDHVARFAGKPGASFVHIGSPIEGVWVFANDGETEPVASIVFDAPAEEEGE